MTSSFETLQKRAKHDTLTIWNSIELIKVESLTVGFTVGRIRCAFSRLPPIETSRVTGHAGVVAC